MGFYGFRLLGVLRLMVIGLGVLFRVSMGIGLYFGRGRASIMNISFCVGVWWLWGRGGGKGVSGKLIGAPKPEIWTPVSGSRWGVWVCYFFWWGAVAGEGCKLMDSQP